MNELSDIAHQIEGLKVQDQLELVKQLLDAGKFKLASAILDRVNSELSVYVKLGKIMSAGLLKTVQEENRREGPAQGAARRAKTPRERDRDKERVKGLSRRLRNG
jgi:hypothetical protein